MSSQSGSGSKSGSASKAGSSASKSASASKAASSAKSGSGGSGNKAPSGGRGGDDADPGPAPVPDYPTLAGALIQSKRAYNAAALGNFSVKIGLEGKLERRRETQRRVTRVSGTDGGRRRGELRG